MTIDHGSGSLLRSKLANIHSHFPPTKSRKPPFDNN